MESAVGHGFIRPSSMAAQGVTYAGGRIDAGYRGEILVCLINTNQPEIRLHCIRDERGFLTDAVLEKADVSLHVRKGDKIAQMFPLPALAGGEVIRCRGTFSH